MVHSEEPPLIKFSKPFQPLKLIIKEFYIMKLFCSNDKFNHKSNFIVWINFKKFGEVNKFEMVA